MSQGDKKKTIVIKIGSNTITNENGNFETKLVDNLAKQASQLFNNNWTVVIVSSGAVALGLPRMKNCDRNSILCKQRAAARGQPILMAGWREAFFPYSVEVDQLLFNKKNFTQHIAVLKAITDGIVIANGDDTGNDPTTETKVIYEDNDDLAADIAIALHADILVYLTDVPGILDKNGTIVQKVYPYENLLKKGIRYNGTNGKGTGGLKSKHKYASRAAKHGIHAIITSGKQEEILLKSIDGNSVGTQYVTGNIILQ